MGAVSILALIPLVKVISSLFIGANQVNEIYPQLHDLATHELALRIGGTKTGLLNASLVRFLFRHFFRI